MDAQIVEIRGGWAAVGDGWAVFGQSPDEVAERYSAAERKHQEILSRDIVDNSGHEQDD